jgi:hypothetical protein
VFAVGVHCDSAATLFRPGRLPPKASPRRGRMPHWHIARRSAMACAISSRRVI